MWSRLRKEMELHQGWWPGHNSRMFRYLQQQAWLSVDWFLWRRTRFIFYPSPTESWQPSRGVWLQEQYCQVYSVSLWEFCYCEQVLDRWVKKKKMHFVWVNSSWFHTERKIKALSLFFPRSSQCAVHHLRGKFHCPMHSTVWLIFSGTQRLKVNIGAGLFACSDLYFL